MTIAPDTTPMNEAYRVNIKGTSHGDGIRTIIEDCPPDIALDSDFIQRELTLRSPGQAFTTPRNEADEFTFVSGVSKAGYTTGETVEVFVPNRGQRSSAYDKFDGVLRPGHGIVPLLLRATALGEEIETAGGGAASARLTIGNVIAGSIAQLAMSQQLNREVTALAWVSSMGPNIAMRPNTPITEEAIYESLVRCPDPTASKKMEAFLELVTQAGTSIGAQVDCEVQGFPGGVGARPGVSLDGRIAGALMTVNGVKGVVIGKQNAHREFGSSYTDEIDDYEGLNIKTFTNNAGGILGGFSTGEPIRVSCLFKPTSSDKTPRRSVNMQHERVMVQMGEEDRHDPCVAIRGAQVVKHALLTALYQGMLADQQALEIIKSDMQPYPRAERVSEQDFTKGLLAALSLAGVDYLNTRDDQHQRGFGRVVEKITEAKKTNTKLRRLPDFQPTPITGNFASFDQDILRLQESDIVRVQKYGMSVQICFDQERALRVMEGFTPIEQALFRDLAELFRETK